MKGIKHENDCIKRKSEKRIEHCQIVKIRG